MIKKLQSAITGFLKWVKYLLWTRPAVEPTKATDVFQNYIVIIYGKQKINLDLSKNELTKWNLLSRYDRRAMAKKFAMMEKKGIIRFEKIEGKWVCIKNRDYQALAEKAKEARHGI